MSKEQSEPWVSHEELEEIALEQAYLCALCGDALDDREEWWAFGGVSRKTEVLCKRCAIRVAHKRRLQ
jgi:hypothetical protein